MSQGQIDYLNEKQYLLDCGTSEKSTHHKYDRIAMQGMTGANDKIRLVMTIVPRGCYLANSCNYILPTGMMDLYCLLGFLNSKTLNWFFRCFSTNSNVNGYEVDNFPIPKITQIEQEKLSILVKRVIEAKRQDSTFDTSIMESEIDSLVYKAYCLNVEEIQIIEHSV